MGDKAILLGIDGFLKGNESSIISYPPFIKCPISERYAVVLKLGWDCDTGKYLSWMPSKEEIKKVGIYFDFEQDVSINQNDLVALVGPAFFQNLKTVGDKDILDILGAKIPIQNGFFIIRMTYNDYNSFLETLSETAQKVFDEEIGKVSINSKKLRPRCKAALDLLVRNPKTGSEDRHVAKLAAAMLEKDTRAYREYLEFAVIDYEDSGVSREAIKDWVKQYFEITNREIFELLYSPPKDREFVKELVKAVVKEITPIIGQSISDAMIIIKGDSSSPSKGNGKFKGKKSFMLSSYKSDHVYRTKTVDD